MQKCSYPGCDHAGDFITNLHCQTKHNMTKKEVLSKFGEFKVLNLSIKGSVVEDYRYYNPKFTY